MFKLFINVLAIMILASKISIAEVGKIKDSSIQSLLVGVNSNNLGLRASCANMLGELKCKKGLIPLMRMLKDDESEDARIIAALALYKIGDARGIFTIKQAIKFDESERVRRLCSIFYSATMKKTSDTEFLVHQ